MANELGASTELCFGYSFYPGVMEEADRLCGLGKFARRPALREPLLSSSGSPSNSICSPSSDALFPGRKTEHVFDSYTSVRFGDPEIGGTLGSPLGGVLARPDLRSARSALLLLDLDYWTRKTHEEALHSLVLWKKASRDSSPKALWGLENTSVLLQSLNQVVALEHAMRLVSELPPEVQEGVLPLPREEEGFWGLEEEDMFLWEEEIWQEEWDVSNGGGEDLSLEEEEGWSIGEEKEKLSSWAEADLSLGEEEGSSQGGEEEEWSLEEEEDLQTMLEEKGLPLGESVDGVSPGEVEDEEEFGTVQEMFTDRCGFPYM